MSPPVAIQPLKFTTSVAFFPRQRIRRVDGPSTITVATRGRAPRVHILRIALSTAAPQAKTAWLPDMNHVLVDVSDDADNLASYGQSARALDATMIDDVAAFILEGAAR